MSRPVRIAIMASGRGSNALALLQTAQGLASDVCVPLLVCDQPAAPVLQRLAPWPDTQAALLPRQDGRAAHEQAILQALAGQRIDWIFLAGYMRLLSPAFVQQWQAWHAGAQQIVNIHPSLLPAYPGLDAVRRAVAAGEEHIGVTLHFVDEGMDSGHVIAQASTPHTAGEAMEALMTRVHALEHQLYTHFLQQLASGAIVTESFQENSP